MLKQFIGLIGVLTKKVRFRIRLRQMDLLWYLMDGSSFDLFPPSFYYTHTEKEIQQAADKIFAELQNMIDEYTSKKLVVGK